MTREQIVQAVRGWLKTLLTLTDGQVVAALGPGVRPSGAHIAVRVSADASVHGPDQTYAGVAAALTLTVSDHRRVSIDLDAYGVDAEEWLQTVGMVWGTMHPSLAALRVAGLGCGGDVGPLQDRATALDGAYEPRYGLSLTGYHRATLAAASVGAASQVDVDADLQPSGAPVVASSTEAP